RGELGVAEGGEEGGDAGDDVGEEERRAGGLAGDGAGGDEDAGADDGADAEGGELEGAERPPQAALALAVVRPLAEDPRQRLAREERVRHVGTSAASAGRFDSESVGGPAETISPRRCTPAHLALGLSRKIPAHGDPLVILNEVKDLVGGSL